MKYHILDETKIIVASFRNESDRDNCFAYVFEAFYEDCKWHKLTED